EQVERRRGGRDGKQDGKPEDDQPKDGESGKKYGERNDVDHGQLWYGVDVLTNNRDHQQSKDSDTDPATGHLNEGPCAAVVTVLLDEMEKVGITGSCMVGVVLSLSGGWYATPSGRPSPRFGDAVRRTAEITGLPIEFVQRSNIAPVHSDNMRDKKARKYIDGTDISTFGPKAKSGQYQNYPQGGKDSEKEAALGAPGTCSLPKLVAHLIGLQDPPQHASEKWFSIDGKQVNVRVAEDDKQTTAHDHGDSVPSCRTCRPIVAEQMKGIDKAVASFLKEAKARTLAIAARRKAHAEALHRYTQIALAQLPAFSVDSSMVNEATGLDLERYAQMQEWYRSLVGILVGDRLEALVAANDERYAEADLDGELDLDLGPLVEARLQPPEDAAADDEAELDDDEEEQHGSKKQAKVNAKKQQKDAKRERKAQNRGKTKYRTGKSTPSAEVESAPPPPRREPTDADQIMVDILVELAGVSRLWAEMPKAAWSGVRRSTGFDFERNADKDLAVQLEVARIWDDLRAELGRLQSDNAESGEEED
ncbi:MAG TPA: hypothetical protein VN253_21150, partial [Kofleriaceae bacterium]|nr:hypothetical protein [Kofleriaceae bacterium]